LHRTLDEEVHEESGNDLGKGIVAYISSSCGTARILRVEFIIAYQDFGEQAGISLTTHSLKLMVDRNCRNVHIRPPAM
jgi:hypothetical protein